MTPEPADAQPRRARILVIDDEPSITRMLQRTLGNYHDLTVTPNARAALTTVQVPWDMILCDIMMPDMDGITFYHTLRARDRELADKVVFVTGAWDVPTQTFLESVPNPYLEKPIDLSLLRRIIASRTGDPNPL